MPTQPIDDYCLNELRQHDRARFLMLLFAPSECRADLAALYAFNLEVAKTREVVREPMMGQIRLQWWRDALAEIYEERTVRLHQVVQPLAAAIVRHKLPRSLLDRMIDAREADLEPHPPGSRDGLMTYIAETAGSLGELAGVISDGDPVKARMAGEVHGLTGLLTAVPFRAQLGRIDLPLDMIADAGTTALDIRDGKAQTQTAAICRDLLETLEPQRKLLRGRLGRKEVFSALPVVLASCLARKLATNGYNPFTLDHAEQQPDLAFRLLWAVFRRKVI